MPFEEPWATWYASIRGLIGLNPLFDFLLTPVIQLFDPLITPVLTLPFN